MRKWILVVLALIMAAPLAATHILVLKNGKTLKLGKPYEVKGQYVLFEGKNGAVNQLPLKIVDLERSKQATEAEQERLAKLEAERNKPIKKQEVRKELSMAEIAAYVESNRDKDNPAKAGVAIGNENLTSYQSNNPRPTNSEVPFDANLADSAADRAQARSDYSSKISEAQKKVKDLDAQITELENYINRFENETAFGEDDTGTFYEANERQRDQLANLKSQRDQAQNELASLQDEARRSGVKVRQEIPQKRKQKKKGRDANKYAGDRTADKFSEQ